MPSKIINFLNQPTGDAWSVYCSITTTVYTAIILYFCTIMVGVTVTRLGMQENYIKEERFQKTNTQKLANFTAIFLLLIMSTFSFQQRQLFKQCMLTHNIHMRALTINNSSSRLTVVLLLLLIVVIIIYWWRIFIWIF